MIKRKYFFSVKVAHNDGTGNYSYWYDFVTVESLLPNPELAMRNIRAEAVFKLKDEVWRTFSDSEVEFLAFNKV